MRKGSSNHRISPVFRGLAYPVQQVSDRRIQLYTFGVGNETRVRDISAAASNVRPSAPAGAESATAQGHIGTGVGFEPTNAVWSQPAAGQFPPINPQVKAKLKANYRIRIDDPRFSLGRPRWAGRVSFCPESRGFCAQRQLMNSCRLPLIEVRI